MFDVPLDFFCSFSVEDESNGEFVTFPHCIGDDVTFFEFIDESVSTGIEKETTDTTKGFSGKEFNFCVRIFRIDEPGWMDLYFIHINALSTNCHDLNISFSRTLKEFYH